MHKVTIIYVEHAIRTAQVQYRCKERGDAKTNVFLLQKIAITKIYSCHLIALRDIN